MQGTKGEATAAPPFPSHKHSEGQRRTDVTCTVQSSGRQWQREGRERGCVNTGKVIVELGGEKERETETETDRQTETHRQRQRHTERQRHKHSDTERQRETERERQKERQRETERDRDRETERERERLCQHG